MWSFFPISLLSFSIHWPIHVIYCCVEINLISIFPAASYIIIHATDETIRAVNEGAKLSVPGEGIGFLIELWKL